MDWFSGYCARAGRTDQLSKNPDHVTLLMLGLVGEIGSVLSELKKEERERDLPASRGALLEELGDALWYLGRLYTIVAPAAIAGIAAREREARVSAVRLADALSLGAAGGHVLESAGCAHLETLAGVLTAVFDELASVAKGDRPHVGGCLKGQPSEDRKPVADDPGLLPFL